MADDHEPALLARARAGDWDAIEDLVSGSIAPTFDAAVVIFGEPDAAAHATEEALLALLVAVRRGELTHGDPLIATGRDLARSAAGVPGPFASGLTPEDLVAITRRPDDARGAEIGRLPAADRVAAVLAFALDLGPEDLAVAVRRSAADTRAAVNRVLDTIPHDHPVNAFHDILDARAARVRVPLDVEERVLDRYERM